MIPIIANAMGNGNYTQGILDALSDFTRQYPSEAINLLKTVKDIIGSKAFWFVLTEQGFEQVFSFIDTAIDGEQDNATAVDVLLTLGDTIFQSHYPNGVIFSRSQKMKIRYLQPAKSHEIPPLFSAESSTSLYYYGNRMNRKLIHT